MSDNLPLPSVPAPVEDPRSLLDRAVENVRDLWRGIAGESTLDGEDPIGRNGRRRLIERMTDCLEARGGEVSARARAASLGHEYLALGPEGRAAFLRILAEEFAADEAAGIDAAKAYLGADDPARRRHAAKSLVEALEAPRVRLLTQFNALPEGVKFLVDMRGELLRLASEDEVFAGLLDDLTRLLRSWFDVGFLELRRMTWNAPASLLEKLIAYEAVHEISGWEDLKNRLDSDRRCFAFFHPRMPEEPLIFVEVALTDGIADNIHDLLDRDAPVTDPEEADTAIFYSISNAQQGLAGISFGNFLIKRVVELLKGEFPRLRRFATLSPLPGFAKWLKSQPVEDILTKTERKALPARSDGDQHPLALVRNPDWYRNEYLAGLLKEPLMRLAARYLAREKRPDGRALDPVAHFHLTNGARIEQMDWLADLSPKGLRQSAGLMVNYLYRMEDIERNHEAYTGDGRVSMASAIRSLARR